MFRKKRNFGNDALFMITGAAAGGILALLFAPKKGSELRSDIKNEVDNTILRTREAAAGIISSGDELVRRASELLNVSQQVVGDGYQSAMGSLQHEITGIGRAFSSAIEAYKNYKKTSTVSQSRNLTRNKRRVDKVFTTGEVEYSDETLPKYEGMGRQQS